MTQKNFGNKWPWPNQGTIQEPAGRNWGKPEKHVREAGFLVKTNQRDSLGQLWSKKAFI